MGITVFPTNRTVRRDSIRVGTSLLLQVVEKFQRKAASQGRASLPTKLPSLSLGRRSGHGFLAPGESVSLNRHFDWFIRFCRGHGCVQQTDRHTDTQTWADVGFYKGGCPIHLKGALEVERLPPIILTHVTGTERFFWL